MGVGRTHIRVRAEGLGISTKTTVTYLALLYDSGQRLTLPAFALGQLTYALVVFFTYVVEMPDARLWPKPLKSTANSRQTRPRWLAEFFDPTAFHLSVTMTLQSIVKHFLTEGDKFLVSYWSPLQDQGGYAIAVNYGTTWSCLIVPRLIYLLQAPSSLALSFNPSKKCVEFIFLGCFRRKTAVMR